MTKRVFKLVHAEARRRAQQAVSEAQEGDVVTISPPGRSLEQNAAQWPILQAFADQLEWPVNGKMTKLTPEEFKHILSAAFFKETARLAQGLNGEVVMLGQKTSRFSKKQFSEWIDFLKWVAAERGVNLETP